MNVKLLLIILILVGAFAVRFIPVFAYEYPLKYDSYWHARMAELFKSKGFVSEIPWPEPRPNFYVPGYHILLAFLSLISGVSTLQISRFIIAAASWSLCLTPFLFKKHLKEKTYLSIFFLAFLPFIINASYDSPEIISVLLGLTALYFIENKKYFHSCIFIFLSSFFNIFGFLLVSVPILSLLFLEKEKKYWVFAPALSFLLIYYLPLLSQASSFSNEFGTEFVSKTIDYWMKYYTPAILLGLFTCLFFIPKKQSNFEKAMFIWFLISCTLFLTHYFTQAFHPWRYPLFISISFSLLLPSFINKTKNSLIPISCIVLAVCLILVGYLNSYVQTPPFTKADYLIFEKASEKNGTLLGSYTSCGLILTLFNKSCELDLYFESLPNFKKWKDFESIFWTSNPDFVEDILKKYGVDYVVFSTSDWGAFNLDAYKHERIAITWNEYGEGALYRVK
ncbi:MAG: hypothetical protein QW735_02345 [archaeon]